MLRRIGCDIQRSFRRLAYSGERAVRPLLSDKLRSDVLTDPILNKGTAWSHSERERLGLRGLLPARVLPLEKQVERFLFAFRKESDDLTKYRLLRELQDRNETLFFRVVSDYIKEMAPYVYTPTVGRACQEYGQILLRGRGMYFTPEDRGHFLSMLYNFGDRDIDVIVVTDGSRILGLGDLGMQGMAIPIGKLILYTAVGGIHPSRVLPVVLDFGTNNAKLRNDPNYLGVLHPRLEGEEYVSLVDEFMDAVRHRWPRVLVQFEDFATQNAQTLLERYMDDYLCFNDDTQGTGAVVLAGIYSAMRALGEPLNSLSRKRVVCVGAGSAGLGVVRALRAGMAAEGVDLRKAQSQFWIVDHEGLITHSRNKLFQGQHSFARHERDDEGMSLIDVVKKVKPHILLGLSGKGGVFTEEVVKEMATHHERPVIFPLSNPTDAAECTAEQAYRWTDGRVIFASGSPFNHVTLGDRIFHPTQGNNMFIFPAIGLASVACQAQRVAPSLFITAAKELSRCVSHAELSEGKVYPDIGNIRDVTLRVAVAVAKEIFNLRLNTIPEPRTEKLLRQYLVRSMYEPSYQPVIYDPHHAHPLY